MTLEEAAREFHEHQEKEKMMSEMLKSQGSVGMGCSTNAVGCNLQRKPTLRQNLRAKLESAIESSKSVEQLRELDYLLDKNPEVARILELLDVALNH